MGLKATEPVTLEVEVKTTGEQAVDEYHALQINIMKVTDHPEQTTAFITWEYGARVNGVFYRATDEHGGMRQVFLTAADLAPAMQSDVTPGRTFEDEFKSQVWSILQAKLDAEGDPMVPAGSFF